ncbi:MAG: hypothetical protein ISS45_07240 [Candidatus Omnitrophica bacterium]|nr:hypothetical protein [Candidatus Omnitrophota bacterium]
MHFIIDSNPELPEDKKTNLAISKIKKAHPNFGDPDDTTHDAGDDRPLPFELKNRINIYIQKRFLSDPAEFKREIEQSLTFNALIRKEIRAGRL